jgi:hypothetical protein
MAKAATPNKPQTRASAGKPAASPPRVRAPLKTIDDVKAEMARLYREAKGGKRDASDASKLANMLSILARLIEGADFERRLEQIEARQAADQTQQRAGRAH